MNPKNIMNIIAYGMLAGNGGLLATLNLLKDTAPFATIAAVAALVNVAAFVSLALTLSSGTNERPPKRYGSYAQQQQMQACYYTPPQQQMMQAPPMSNYRPYEHT